MSQPAFAAKLQPAPDIEETSDRAVSFLRLLMRKCRAKARVEVFETCRLLLTDPRDSAQDYADALLGILSQALPNGPVIHHIHAPERSFDENWLLALFAALSRNDHASATFLLRARMPLQLRRPVGWLASELVLRMETEAEQSTRS
ncbi:MAG: hypothetical protein EA407_04095 [Rhodobacteraceae bacterium]|nr:MAG: hypothetical protein EA407_04095 [Paracoccaceae bacterium]